MIPPDARSQVHAPYAGDTLLPLLSARAMAEADTRTIETFGIAGRTLMESAGRAAVDIMEKRYGQLRGQHVFCCCGRGNNGGDGLVMARVLLARGARVTVVLPFPEEKLSPDCAVNLALLQKIAGSAGQQLKIRTDVAGLESAHQADYVVDALLGTGLTSAPREPIATLVRWINEQSATCVAIDIPTGLDSDTGVALDPTVRADLTVTMAALKSGLVLGDGLVHAGDIHLAEIGIPSHLIEDAMKDHPEGCAWLPHDAAIARMLPTRAADAHKYEAGYVLVVGGSEGMAGAPLLSARAAARSGAGYVTMAVPESIREAVHGGFVEATTVALPLTPSESAAGSHSGTELEARIQRADAMVLGPGLGRTDTAQQLVVDLLSSVDLPVVIDADALFALVEHPELLHEYGRPSWVLTPHAGEFSRLAGEGTGDGNPIELARTYASQWNCTLVLKGRPSVVASPDKRVAVDANGSSALATAGSGDVLAGLIGGLLAQNLSPFNAALCGLEIGGATARFLTKRRSATSLIASDLLEALPDVLHSRYGQ